MNLDAMVMIKDPTVLQEIRDSWKGVEALRDKLQASLLGSFAQGGTFAIFAADAAHNFPFVHACAVLNDVLQQLKRERHFRCSKIFLGALFSASKTKLPWISVPIIEEAIDRRNDIAHRGDVLPRKDCWRYIDAIKAELVSWGVL